MESIDLLTANVLSHKLCLHAFSIRAACSHTIDWGIDLVHYNSLLESYVYLGQQGHAICSQVLLV